MTLNGLQPTPRYAMQLVLSVTMPSACFVDKRMGQSHACSTVAKHQLCDALVLRLVQFVYDLWWGHITPDTDFPKDIRRVLNSAFGELAARAQHADLKRMLLT